MNSKSFEKKMDTLERLVDHVRRGQTGDAPEFAKKLEISERTFRNYLALLRLRGVPIKHNKSGHTYEFDGEPVKDWWKR